MIRRPVFPHASLGVLTALALSGCLQSLPKQASPTPAPALTPAATPDAVGSQPPRQAAAATPPPPAAPQSRRAEFSGIWTGQIDCGRGAIPIVLQIYPVSPPGSMAARGELPDAKGANPNLAYFSLQGEASVDVIRLRWDRWTYKAQRFPQLSLEGRWSDAPERIAMAVPDSSCKPFDLRRKNAAALTTVATAPATLSAAIPLPAPTAPPMSYADLLKQITATKGDPVQMRTRLVGRQLRVSLRTTGPQALMANPKDGVYFVCKERAVAFKGGTLTARVAGYELSPDGDPSIELERCAP